MDHLFHDMGSGEAPEIPVLGLAKFDDSEWESFPTRCGYTSEAIQTGAFSPPWMNIEEYSFASSMDPNASQPTRDWIFALSVLQEWLYIGFGVEYSRILGLPANREDFTRSKDDRELASSSSIPHIPIHLLKNLMEREDALEDHDIPSENTTEADAERDRRRIQTILDFTPDAREELMQRVMITSDQRDRLCKMSETAFRFLDGCLEVCKDPFPPTDSMQIWFSCSIMVESLRSLGYRLDCRPAVSINLDHPFFTFHALLTGLCPSKLCPLALRRDRPVSRAVISVTDLYLAFKTNRKRLLDHSSCTTRHCVLFQSIDNLPLHRYPCQGDCGFIGVNDSAKAFIQKALEDGTYPICRIIETDVGKPELRWTTKATCQQPYIAFSHVWYVYPV